MTNSALKKTNEKKSLNKPFNAAMLIGSGLQDFKSIGSAKTGGERLQKIGELIIKAIGAGGG